jgi:hypothetical protein
MPPKFSQVLLQFAVAYGAILGCASAQELTAKVTYCYAYNIDLQTQRYKHVDVYVDVIDANWRNMKSIVPAGKAAMAAAESQCRAAKYPSASLMALKVNVKTPRGRPVVNAELNAWRPETRTLRVTYDNRAAVARQEDEEKARDEAIKTQIAANEKRKEAAIKDCAGGPKLSGGPWFSSTYSVAANDEVNRAKRDGYFCIKTVEYVSAAPNPFGGKAARAKFIGYNNRNFAPLVQVRDFPY